MIGFVAAVTLIALILMKLTFPVVESLIVQLFSHIVTMEHIIIEDAYLWF